MHIVKFADIPKMYNLEGMMAYIPPRYNHTQLQPGCLAHVSIHTGQATRLTQLMHWFVHGHVTKSGFSLRIPQYMTSCVFFVNQSRNKLKTFFFFILFLYFGKGGKQQQRKLATNKLCESVIRETGTSKEYVPS